MPCYHLYKPVAQVISSYDAVPEDGMCYRKLLVGTDGENYMSSPRGIVLKNFSRDMKAMRSLYYKAHNVPVKPKMDCIVILQKRSGYNFFNINNIREIVDMLRSSFPAYEVIVAAWEDYSMKGQLELLAHTRLMISLPGAALMSGIFMQEGSAIITFCRGSQQRKGIEYHYWFDNLDYGTYLQFCKEDETKAIGQDTYVYIPKLKENIEKLMMWMEFEDVTLLI